MEMRGTMRKTLAVSSGAIVSAVLTHGFVYSSIRLAGALSPLTYQGFFQNMILSIWGIWNHLQGWPADRSHVEEFGRFCMAPFVLLVCPVVGFAIFTIVARLPIGRHCWKPIMVAIALTVLAIAVPNPLRSVGLDVAQAEAGRAAVVFFLMIWTVAAPSGCPTRCCEISPL